MYCVRKLFNKNELIRFVVDHQKRLIPDLDQKLPGPGYVKADRLTLQASQKKFVFPGLERSLSVIPNAIQIIEYQLRMKILFQISLSRKAGVAIFGFEKVKAIILCNQKILLIQATDGSIKEKKRISVKNEVKILNDYFDSVELGRVFGRQRVIHCAILGRSFIETILFIANRLNNLKNPVPQYTNS